MQEFVPVERQNIITFPKASTTPPKPNVEQEEEKEAEPPPPFQTLLVALQEFTGGTHSIALLIGAKSSGKTTLLDLFNKTSSSTQFLHHSHGKLQIPDPLNEVRTSLNEDSAVFEKMAAALLTDQQPCLLLDDADLLNLEEFQSLLAFFMNPPAQGFKIVLSGDTTLIQRVEKLIEKDASVMNFTTLKLIPLSLQEMKKYIIDTFGQSLNKNHKILSHKNLEKIYHLSKGYPGRINRVASQVIAEFNGVSVPVKRKKNNYFDRIILGGIILLLSGVGAQVYHFLSSEHVQVERNIPQIKVVTQKIPTFAPVVKTDPVFQNEAPPSSFIASIEGFPEERLNALPVENSLLILPKPYMKK